MKVSKIRATGGCIIAKDTHRLLLQQRTIEGSFPRNWAFFGGKVEENENSGYINLLEILSTIDHFLFPKFMYSRNKKSKHEKRFNLEDYEMNILSTKELKQNRASEITSFMGINFKD